MDKKSFAHKFLIFVEELSYLPSEQIIMKMMQILDHLFMVNNNYNNFHNEPPHAMLLNSYVPSTGNITEQIVSVYGNIKVHTKSQK